MIIISVLILVISDCESAVFFWDIAQCWCSRMARSRATDTVGRASSALRQVVRIVALFQPSVHTLDFFLPTLESEGT